MRRGVVVNPALMSVDELIGEVDQRQRLKKYEC